MRCEYGDGGTGVARSFFVYFLMFRDFNSYLIYFFHFQGGFPGVCFKDWSVNGVLYFI